MPDQTDVPGLSAQGKGSQLVNLHVLLPGTKSAGAARGVSLSPVLVAMPLSSWWVRPG